MPTPRKLKSGAPAHEFTEDERARGREAQAASREAKRAAAEEAVHEVLTAQLTAAAKRQWELLASDDEAVAGRTVREIFDRTLGRATVKHDHEVSGNADAPIVFEISAAKLARAKEILDDATGE